MKYLNNENLQIKTDAIKLLAKTLRYSNRSQTDDIMKYIENEIIGSKTTYCRRLFFVFFEVCLKIFSISYIKEKRLINLLIRLMEDNINIANKALSLVPKFYILIIDDVKLVNFINSGVKYIKNLYIKDIFTAENLILYEKQIEKLTESKDNLDNVKLFEIDREKYDNENKFNYKDPINITTIKNDREDDLFMQKILIKKNHSKKLPSFSESYLKKSISKIINSTNSSSLDLQLSKTINLRSLKNISAKQKILSVASNHKHSSSSHKHSSAHTIYSPSKDRDNNLTKMFKNSTNSDNNSNSENNSKFLVVCDKSIDLKMKTGPSLSAVKDGTKFIIKGVKNIDDTPKILSKNIKITLNKCKK